VKNKYSLLYTIAIFLLIVGISLVLTVIFRVWGDSLARGEYKGIFFGGSIAMFIGLFLVLIKGFKTIHTAISSTLGLIIVLLAYQISETNNTFEISHELLAKPHHSQYYIILLLVFIALTGYFLRYGKK
jgi:ABC-type Fe3+-siderophore transport system permease subunit